MRRISAQIESLGATRFILLIGLIGGTIQSAPQLLLGGASSTRLQLLPFLVIGLTAIFWWSAGFLLWSVAMRRQQSVTWIIAIQVTVGLTLADLLHAVLAAVPAAIDSHGEFAAAIV